MIRPTYLIPKETKPKGGFDNELNQRQYISVAFGKMLRRFLSPFGYQVEIDTGRYTPDGRMDAMVSKANAKKGFSVKSAYERLMRGTGTATDQELGFINQNPQVWDTVNFHNGPNPLPLPSTNYQ